MILRYASVVILYSPLHSMNATIATYTIYLTTFYYIYEQDKPIKNTFINTQNTIHKTLTNINKGKESL